SFKDVLFNLIRDPFRASAQTPPAGASLPFGGVDIGGGRGVGDEAAVLGFQSHDSRQHYVSHPFSSARISSSATILYLELPDCVRSRRATSTTFPSIVFFRRESS